MTITSTATSGWALSKGTVNITSGAVTFASQSTQIDLGTGLAGLYSPNETLTIAPSANTATSVTVNKDSENFYQCSTYNGNAYVTRSSQGEVPTVVRIVNGNESASACTVTILVVLSEDNSNSRYAAAGLTFYFADGAGNIYTLGYNYEDASAYSVNNAAGSKKVYTDTTALKDAKDGDILAHTSTNKVEKSTTIGGDVPTYDSATATGSATTFRKNGETAVKAADNTEILPANATFLAYTFTTDSIAKGLGINFATYAWIDGWKADDAARGSTINIYYSFGGELTLPTTPADKV